MWELVAAAVFVALFLYGVITQDEEVIQGIFALIFIGMFVGAVGISLVMIIGEVFGVLK